MRRLVAIVVMLGIFWPAVSSAAVPKPAIRAVLNYSELPAGQQAIIAIAIDVPPRYHIQSHKPLDENLIPLEVTVEPHPALELFAPIFPDPVIKRYPVLGTLSVFEGRTIVYVPLQVKSVASSQDIAITGTVGYQMCDDRACFAPEDQQWEIQTSIVPADRPLQIADAELFAEFDFSRFAELIAPLRPPAPKVNLLGQELTPDRWLLPFIAAIIIGMIFNVMPCVLPVIPLKIMSFYEVSQHRRSLSFALGIIFSLGIVTVFFLLGLFVVVLRKLDWGEMFANPLFLGGIVILLTIFALHQFGAFNVGLPSTVYRYVPRHDTYTGNYLFGIFTAILSTPCTFGMFMGLLIWAVAQPAMMGLALMIAVGIGMAAPYVVLSAAPELARNFPRTGPWSELIKQMMGFLLLASAVFFARRFIQPVLGADGFWWLFFAVILAAGVFLILQSIRLSQTMWPRIVATAIALLLVAPALAFTLRQTNPPIDWRPYASEALAEARQSGRIVMLEFTAAWCGNCLALEATTLHDKRTVEAVRRLDVVTFRADLTDSKAPGWGALRELSAVGAIPLTALFAPGLSEPIQLTGIYSTAQLIEALERASLAADAGRDEIAAGR